MKESGIRRIQSTKGKSISPKDSIENVTVNKSSTGTATTKSLMTAAELVRQRQQRMNSKTTTTSTTTNNDIVTPKISIQQSSIDVDDEIKRLEQELQQLDDDDDDDQSTSTSSDDANDDNNNNNDNIDTTSGMIISLSQSNQVPIERLPEHYLPPVPKKKRSNHENVDSNDITKSKRSKTKSNSSNIEKDSGQVLNHHPNKVSNGLKHAVQEMIQNYQPRSSEHIPFYCKYCSQQYNNYNDFIHHQTSSYHQQQKVIYEKASYCTLCHKQLTSPTQLQDHLQSKPHKERLFKVQSKQNRNNKQTR